MTERELIAAIVRDAQEYVLPIPEGEYEGYGHDAASYYAADRILELSGWGRKGITEEG